MATKRTRPYDRLQAMVRIWGWRDRLRQYQHRPERKALGLQPDLPRVITWYEAGISGGGRNDCFLQLNESPQGQDATYNGAVFAVRYRLFTGWHPFRLFSRESAFEREAARLADWLAWDWFGSVERRRALRQAHPECVGYTWRKIRESNGA